MQRFVSCAPLSQVDTPTSVRSIPNNAYGRLTPGKTQRPPVDRAMDVPCEHFPTQVAHGGDHTGVRVEHLGPHN